MKFLNFLWACGDSIFLHSEIEFMGKYEVNTDCDEFDTMT